MGKIFRAQNRKLYWTVSLVLIYALFLLYIITDPRKDLGWVDYYAWINIAEKYASGHWKEALNAYWSPLIIWVLVPFVKFHLFEAKEIWVINFVAGLILIRFSFILARQFLLTGLSEFFFVLFFVIFSISFQLLFYDSADFLSSVCLIGYIIALSSDSLRTNQRHYFYTIGAALLCVFSKSFYLYFVLLHLLILLVYHGRLRNKEESHAFKNALFTFATVVFVMGIWIALMSWKYERFMINSSGKHNMAVMTPQGIKEDFDAVHGLFPPPDAYSCHHWIDPTYYGLERSVFKNSETLNYQFDIYSYNARIAVYLFSYFSYFKLAVIFFILPVFFIQDKRAQERIVHYFLSALLIIGGYFLIFLEERYMGGVQLLLFLFAYLSVYVFLSERKFAKKKWILSFVSILVFIAFAKIGLVSWSHWFDKNARHLDGLFVFEDEVKQLRFMKNARYCFTTSQSEVGAPMYYELFHVNGSSNYGSFRKGSSSEEQYDQLRKYEIDYYFYIGCKESELDSCQESLPFYLEKKKPLYTNAEFGVKVYAMKPYQ